MTTAQINILDHLDQDEMKRIAADAFTAYCVEKFRTDSERIFSNAAYGAVRKMVDEAFDGRALDLVTENTKRVITQMSAHTVFGSKGVYDREDTAGRKAITAAVTKHNQRIENRVAALIDSITKDDVLTALMDAEVNFKLSPA
nr:hypothetical protein [uncultured Roseovarius sp.]